MGDRRRRQSGDALCGTLNRHTMERLVETVEAVHVEAVHKATVMGRVRRKEADDGRDGQTNSEE